VCVCSTGSRSVQKFLSSRVPCVRAAEFSHYAGRCWTCCGRGTLDLLTLFWTRRICCSWAFGGAPRQFAASLVVLFDHCTQVTGVCVVCDKKKLRPSGRTSARVFARHLLGRTFLVFYSIVDSGRVLIDVRPPFSESAFISTLSSLNCQRL
jgi:hypothetical protein